MQQSSEQDGDEDKEEGDIYGRYDDDYDYDDNYDKKDDRNVEDDDDGDGEEIYMVTSGRPVTVSAVITGIMDIHHIPGGRKGGNQWR